MKWPAAIALASSIALVGSIASSAHAQEADNSAQAREHFELGVRLIEQGRWQDAARELEVARQLRPTAPVLYNLGIAQRGVGRTRAAIASFREFLTLLGERAPPARRAEVEGYIVELEASLAHVAFQLEPSAASLVVDGEAVSSGHEDVVLDPGQHRIRVEAEGYEPAFRDITLEPGARERVEVALTELETRGRLRIESSTHGAVVRISGRNVGPPPYDEELEPGTYAVEVTAPGHAPYEREVEVAIGDAITLRADLVSGEQLHESPVLWGITGGVAVAIALVVGLVVGLSRTEDPLEGELGLVTGVLTVRP
jgi:hypothetical protein